MGSEPKHFVLVINRIFLSYDYSYYIICVQYPVVNVWLRCLRHSGKECFEVYMIRGEYKTLLIIGCTVSIYNSIVMLCSCLLQEVMTSKQALGE